MQKKRRSPNTPVYIYVGSDSREDSQCKVGMTTRSPRARESETTNPYYGIEDSYALYVSRHRLSKIESDIHLLLEGRYKRIKHRSTGAFSEWFRCSSSSASSVIEEYLATLPKREIEPPQKKVIEYKSRPISHNNDDSLDIISTVIRDCVLREKCNSPTQYDYDALYFRCPECKSVTKQNTSDEACCNKCRFDLHDYEHIDSVSSLLNIFNESKSRNEKQAALFDIYNLVFKYKVRMINDDFEQKKTHRKYNYPEGVDQKSSKLDKLRDVLSKTLVAYITIAIIIMIYVQSK
ncbi:GIY-YIG nuclease family protein [Vibrio maritimus]|uniref:GIY-YIG nuclease family protein n=1 Tax=Vibrio maritimus TaxID=990268 RepID=UPI003736340E